MEALVNEARQRDLKVYSEAVTFLNNAFATVAALMGAPLEHAQQPQPAALSASSSAPAVAALPLPDLIANIARAHSQPRPLPAPMPSIQLPPLPASGPLPLPQSTSAALSLPVSQTPTQTQARAMSPKLAVQIKQEPMPVERKAPSPKPVVKAEPQTQPQQPQQQLQQPQAQPFAPLEHVLPTPAELFSFIAASDADVVFFENTHTVASSHSHSAAPIAASVPAHLMINTRTRTQAPVSNFNPASRRHPKTHTMIVCCVRCINRATDD